MFFLLLLFFRHFIFHITYFQFIFVQSSIFFLLFIVHSIPSYQPHSRHYVWKTNQKSYAIDFEQNENAHVNWALRNRYNKNWNKTHVIQFELVSFLLSLHNFVVVDSYYKVLLAIHIHIQSLHKAATNYIVHLSRLSIESD